MMFKQKLTIVSMIMILWSSLLTPFSVMALQSGEDLKEQLNIYVHERQKVADIPGLAIVAVSGENIIYEKYAGYSDVERKKLVTRDTVFEIGSNSKAFTGLAILQLENEGMIRLDDQVSKYLPWFYMNNNGMKSDMTIRQLLYHTSAIPPETINDIPILDTDDALEQTVRMLVGKEIMHHKRLQPGEYFTYATINYDILGMIIQQVTDMSYEDYMQQNIFRPLGLNHTFVRHEDAVENGLATGYKFGFLSPRAYEAPRYRGNTPAGYVSSTPMDIAKWMKIQLGAVKPGGIDSTLIEKSHEIDTSVSPDMDGSSYAAGWSIYQSGNGEIMHGGNNPNFSSFIMMRNDGELGVAVMANLNSDHTEAIARGVMSIIRDRTPVEPVADTYNKLDRVATSMLVALSLILLGLLYMVGRGLVEIRNGKRSWAKLRGWQYVRLSSAFIFLALYLCGLYYIPIVLLNKLSWSMLYVWGPYSFVPAVIAAAALGILYAIYHILTQLFTTKKEQPYFSLLTLGLVSGLGNAFIIFVINLSFELENNLTNGLLFYFALGILMYVYGQRYLSTKLVALTNNLVYVKRTELIGNILKTPYEKLERLEDGRLHAVLNNDTEEVSGSVNVVITGVISLVTLICCFIYLGTLNLYALMLSIGVIVVVAGLFFLLGNKAERLWEESRDIQTVFFRLIGDMLKGFKELKLNQNKNRDFQAHMENSSNLYRVKRIEADVRFANVNVAGEMLFTVVIGAVAFLFPVIFPNLLTTTVQAYVFIFLYMTGPVNNILNAYPTLLRSRISWNRIKELSAEIKQLQNSEKSVEMQNIPNGKLELTIRDLSYGYGIEEDNHFSVGPFDLSFRAGTITFITGGNGSGKTTLAKLITGLYKPTTGHISINGKITSSEELSAMFSAIFSDYYLFERLYGIDCVGKEEQIALLLERFQLNEKVTIQDGEFSTTMLSTGQKKRLALLLTYLEDRPICLFDEWAADQDPEFRKYFYYDILPELKSRGKCIIAITHDDRYFELADTLIKLERSKYQIIKE